jgi:hypothetical protein
MLKDNKTEVVVLGISAAYTDLPITTCVVFGITYIRYAQNQNIAKAKILNILSLNVPDEGYSRTYPMKDIPECT